MSNGQNDNFSASVEAAIAPLVTLPAGQTPPAGPTVDVSKLDALVGTYNDPYNAGDVHVTRQGDQLKAEVPSLAMAGVPYEPLMTGVSTHVWTRTIAGQPYTFRFLDGPNGET